MIWLELESLHVGLSSWIADLNAAQALPYIGLGVLLAIVIAVPLAWWYSRLVAGRIRDHERASQVASRLEEQATMTRGLAHEIKNPLSSINLNAQLLKEDLFSIEREDLPPNVKEDVRKVVRRFEDLSREVQRLAGILDDFLKFAGRINLDKERVNINDTLASLIDFFMPQADQSRIHLRLQPHASPLYIEIDENLIKQACLNLLLNSAQAMQDSRQSASDSGGNDELIVRVELDTPAPAKQGLARSKIHSMLKIHFTDTGPGMDEATIQKIYQPYFSTKKSGTGLGLPTSRRIIEEHGGLLSVHSELGKGTDFVVSLPVSSSPTT